MSGNHPTAAPAGEGRKTVRPLSAKDRADLRSGGWEPAGWWTWQHAEHGIVRLVDFRWWAIPWDDDRSHGPHSTVWSAIDYLKERPE